MNKMEQLAIEVANDTLDRVRVERDELQDDLRDLQELIGDLQPRTVAAEAECDKLRGRVRRLEECDGVDWRRVKKAEDEVKRLQQDFFRANDVAVAAKREATALREKLAKSAPNWRR